MVCMSARQAREASARGNVGACIREGLMSVRKTAPAYGCGSTCRTLARCDAEHL
ncbi:unnamed protein product, partial [Dovyalis caffra]